MNFFTKRLVNTVIKKQSYSNNNSCLSTIELSRNYSFKSAYALENLYPKSNVNLVTPNFVPESSSKFSGFIPIDELTITSSRSTGPGGQNVNTVNSKIDLRFKVSTATWLSDPIKQQLSIQERNRINKDGYLIIKSDVTRYQHVNLADAMEKLRAIIRKANPDEKIIPAETEERMRKREIKAARERIFQKRIRSQIKQQRNNLDI